jgi:rRNA processing protein Gar1
MSASLWATDIDEDLQVDVHLAMPDKVLYFNGPIYLQNKSVIGKVDEILSPTNKVYFSVNMGEGMVAGRLKRATCTSQGTNYFPQNDSPRTIFTQTKSSGGGYVSPFRYSDDS